MTRPIIFSAPMVKAILEGRKTQTRRPMKPQPESTGSNGGAIRQVIWNAVFDQWDANYFGDNPRMIGKCPYGKPGDLLWVREAYAKRTDCEDGSPKAVHYLLYKADGGDLESQWHGYTKWENAMFMPRWASRITLEITSVRVERLNQISEDDARAEGAMFHNGGEVGHSGWRHDPNDGYVFATCEQSFKRLWSTIHAADGPNGWAANPWVWVIEFRRMA